MKRLILAPHMDDEAMGCGGLIAKHPDECVVVVVTDSGEVRAREHDEAMKILGAAESRQLGFADGQTPHHMTEMVQAIDAIMAELKPEELYLPYPSLHQDHIAVYEAGMRSCRVSMSLDPVLLQLVVHGQHEQVAVEHLEPEPGPRQQVGLVDRDLHLRTVRTSANCSA